MPLRIAAEASKQPIPKPATGHRSVLQSLSARHRVRFVSA